MMRDTRKIVIIGCGIAGLCTAVYARKCGYEIELLEMHEETRHEIWRNCVAGSTLSGASISARLSK